MGSFFGRGKNKDDVKERERAASAAPRPSRRAVVPGAPVAGDQGTRPVRTPTQRVQAPASAPSQSVFAKGKESTSKDSDQLVLAPGDNQVRPDTKGPIRTSSAPQFSGSLADAARNTGPARTGDAALIEFMIGKAKLINAEQAELIKAKAEREQVPLDVAAVALNLVNEDQLVNALTQECWVPHLKVDKYEIRKKALDTVSQEDAVRFSVFPVDKLGSLLTLAMVNPLDLDTIRALESKTGLDIKRVVATRSEIQQGIEKYYGGKVEARDTSISFVADAAQETKSVTQLLGNVKSSEGGFTNETTGIPTPLAEPNITPEIQDIDDLLSADDIIAPAIIESKPLLEEVPLVVPAGEVIEIAESPILDSSPLEARKPAVVSPLPPPVTGRITAPEFDFDETDSLAPAIKPATEVRPPVAKPAAPPARRSPTAPVARPVTGAVRPSTGMHDRPAGQSQVRTTARVANPKLINLIPVLEEEFQHAITHGKAHVFEKWVGLQTRNRIINAVPLEAEYETLLAPIFATANDG
jgi:Type II secretion system (T2SS), protein E, N-terminal domain